MRNLSVAALAKLRQRFGTEPLVILEIQWYTNGGWRYYADRDIPENSIEGRILTLGELDNVVSVLDNTDSQSLSVVLDDSDGALSTILNSTDIHLRRVKVWQWFQGLNFADKFLLFTGKINSPIEWSEGEKTLSFSIVSQIEDREIGFSAEEGIFDEIPAKLIGKGWPLNFGNNENVKSVSDADTITGTTMNGVGILTGNEFYDASASSGSYDSEYIELDRSQVQQKIQKGHLTYVSSAWYGIDNDEADKAREAANQISRQMAQQWGEYLANRTKQQQADAAKLADILNQVVNVYQITVAGGENFPRGVITVNIGGGFFTGSFAGSGNVFSIASRIHPENEATYAENKANAVSQVTIGSSGGGPYEFVSKVPCGKGNFYSQCSYRTYGTIVSGPLTVSKREVVTPIWFWADAGSTVNYVRGGTSSIATAHIASITPGQVTNVRAYRTLGGVRQLMDVPATYWQETVYQLGDIDAYCVDLLVNLGQLGEGWEDTLYISFNASVGPNIVDILEYLINRYTDYSIDATSFNHVGALLDEFDANFYIAERRNILEVLQDIAYQARCRLVLKDETFFITSLPETPTPVDVISESDIEVNSLVVSTTPTEDLATKYTASWRRVYEGDDYKMILKYNVNKYGTHEFSYDFDIFKDPELVEQVAKFWLIRKANTWKTLKFKTFMHKLNLEAFDCVTLNFSHPYIANGPVNGIITKASADTENYTIDMEVWTPVRAGEMEAYDFAWPADVDIRQIFPTAKDYEDGNAGGDPKEIASGTIPIPGGSRRTEATYPSAGSFGLRGVEVVRRNNPAYNPNGPVTDRNIQDRKTPETSRRTEAAAGAEAAPGVDTSAPVKEKGATPKPLAPYNDGFLLDLKYTKVYNQEDSDKTGKLADVLRMTSDGRVCIRDDAHVYDGSNDAEFDFRYYSAGSVWGAGTAFLKPNP